MALEIKSYAKVNLGLWIIGERADGYHDIFTVLRAIGLYDRIRITPIPRGVEIETNAADIPVDQTNLVCVAFNRLQEYRSFNSGIKVTLEKNIPVGGGLGGGSSNAATTLLACNKIFDLKLSLAELKSLGADIGADVPFFMSSGCAYAYGTGKELHELPCEEQLGLIIIYPKVMISSSWAYRNVEKDLTGLPDFINLGKLNYRDYIAHLDLIVNDFEDLVFNAYPQIKRLYDKLSLTDVKKALLTGSGSCLIGVCKDYPSAIAAANELQLPSQSAELIISKTITLS